MSSGHIGKGGRGNRRARRGSQRSRGPEGQNGQPHSSSAMLILSSDGRQPAAHAQRDKSPDDAAAVDAADAGLEEEELERAAGEGELIQSDVQSETPKPTTHAAPESGQSAQSGYGPHDRARPYAPGMRSHMHSPTPLAPSTHAPRTRGPDAEQSGTGAQNTSGLRDDSLSEHEAVSPAAWQERGNARETPVTSATSSRAPRGEHDDRSTRSDRSGGDHEPLRPEVRGEVGPLIDALHGLFERDRMIASQGGTTRCGICYLHFSLSDLEYREEEGFYVCRTCVRSLGAARLPMVRRQQRT